ncbi:hypothetical protein BIW11_02146 [Tropilaelaps mercedesae]|uniref:BHLH domain-containing protein n=1 Tax=Tropilaelaps mercedesae TaxID=418985 RepID=A0A1V9X257_9ACAR|nr:hypothetical protein BIW11_02146 [Tropilaelaps mercedesae]
MYSSRFSYQPISVIVPPPNQDKYTSSNSLSDQELFRYMEGLFDIEVLTKNGKLMTVRDVLDFVKIQLGLEKDTNNYDMFIHIDGLASLEYNKLSQPSWYTKNRVVIDAVYNILYNQLTATLRPFYGYYLLRGIADRMCLVKEDVRKSTCGTVGYTKCRKTDLTVNSGMCGTAIADMSKSFSSAAVVSSTTGVTNGNGPCCYEQQRQYDVIVPVVPCNIPLPDARVTVLPVSPATGAASCSAAEDSSLTVTLPATVSARRDNNPSTCVQLRGGRRTVRRELERQRRSLHAAGVEDLRRMLLPTKSGAVSITQVLQEAVRVVRMVKAEERGALHAKEFLKGKRSYLRARPANIKYNVHPTCGFSSNRVQYDAMA